MLVTLGVSAPSRNAATDKCMLSFTLLSGECGDMSDTSVVIDVPFVGVAAEASLDEAGRCRSPVLNH